MKLERPAEKIDPRFPLKLLAIVIAIVASYFVYEISFGKKSVLPPEKETVTKEETPGPVNEDMKLLQEALQKSREANDLLQEAQAAQKKAEDKLEEAIKIRQEAAEAFKKASEQSKDAGTKLKRAIEEKNQSKRLNEKTQKIMDEMRKELRELKEEEGKEPPKLKFNIPADTIG